MLLTKSAGTGKSPRQHIARARQGPWGDHHVRSRRGATGTAMISARLRPGGTARRAAFGVRTPDLDTSTPAVVLKLDPNVMHHGGLGVIRSLGRLGVPVYGVHEGPLAPAANSVYLRGRCFWQPGTADSGRIRAGLLALA